MSARSCLLSATDDNHRASGQSTDELLRTSSTRPKLLFGVDRAECAYMRKSIFNFQTCVNGCTVGPLFMTQFGSYGGNSTYLNLQWRGPSVDSKPSRNTTRSSDLHSILNVNICVIVIIPV